MLIENSTMYDVCQKEEGNKTNVQCPPQAENVLVLVGEAACDGAACDQ